MLRLACATEDGRPAVSSSTLPTKHLLFSSRRRSVNTPTLGIWYLFVSFNHGVRHLTTYLLLNSESGCICCPVVYVGRWAHPNHYNPALAPSKFYFLLLRLPFPSLGVCIRLPLYRNNQYLVSLLSVPCVRIQRGCVRKS